MTDTQPDSDIEGLTRTASARVRLARDPDATFDGATVRELLATIDNMSDAALARWGERFDPATLADLLYRAGVPLPKGRDSRWYTEIAERITALHEAQP